MKKFISLLSIVLILILVAPIEQVAADRSSGRGSGGGSRGSQGSGGAYRGSSGHGGAYGHGRAPGYRGSPHGYYGRGGHYHYYPGYGAFLPGLIIGGLLGWSLAPPYYNPPPDYYAPPDYSYPPPVEGDQAPPAGRQLSIYPRQGQSREQQDRDHLECHDWAVGQADFDPFAPPPYSRPEAELARMHARYLQALEACLDSRGYDLR